MKAGFHGSHWETRDLGYLVVAEVVRIAQKNDQAMVLVDLGDRFLQHHLNLSTYSQRFGLFERSRPSTRDFDLGKIIKCFPLVDLSSGQVFESVLGVVNSNSIEPGR